MVDGALVRDDYRAAREAAAYRVVEGAGYVRVGGPDAVDFLQRQTTNDVRALAPGKALLNVLTSPTARIAEVFTMRRDGESIGLITPPGRGPALAAQLKRKIFFMDNVTVEDASAEWVYVELAGPGAEALAATAGVGGVVVIEREAALALGPKLLVPAAQIGDVAAALDEAGAVHLSGESYEILRVEAGLPAAGVELTEDYTPLEAGLTHAVSMSKGCYTGQEVVARQVNYDKVTRHLAGLRLQGEAAPGAQVRAGGRLAGTLTSAVRSPVHGWIGLAVLRRPHHEPGTGVSVEGEAGSVGATVAELPF